MQYTSGNLPIVPKATKSLCNADKPKKDTIQPLQGACATPTSKATTRKHTTNGRNLLAKQSTYKRKQKTEQSKHAQKNLLRAPRRQAPRGERRTGVQEREYIL